MKASWKSAIACGGIATLACSEPRDLGTDSGWLDAPAETDSAAEVQTIYENRREHVFGLALDESTLYALVEHDSDFQLVSCPVERCRSERTILYQGAKLSSEGAVARALVLAGGRLSWLRSDPSGAGIVSCPVTGCEELVVQDAIGNVGVDSLVGDDDFLYWTEGPALWRSKGDGSAPQHVRNFAGPDVGHMIGRGDFLYYVSNGLYRLRKDGSEEPEMLAQDALIHGVTAGEDGIYYTTETLTGRIVRCPWDAASCDGALLSNQRFPSTVRQEGGELFWVGFPRLGGPTAAGTLFSCSLPSCSDARERARDLPLPFGEPLRAWVSLVLNRSFAVWIEERRGINGDPISGSALRSIAR